MAFLTKKAMKTYKSNRTEGPRLLGSNLTAHFLYGWYPAVEALTVYYPYLKFRHIQSGTIFGRMVNLEPEVRVVHNQDDFIRVRIMPLCSFPAGNGQSLAWSGFPLL
jgi:hypothetical protein